MRLQTVYIMLYNQTLKTQDWACHLTKLRLLFYLFMVLTCHDVESVTKFKVDIYRGERDIFTNIAGCDKTNAFCLRHEVCTYCQCKPGHTYLQSRGQYGDCVPNDLLVYATSYDASFLVQNNFVSFNQYCIYPKPYGGHIFVRGSLKCNEEDRNFRWILTKYRQLLNYETLTCLTDDYHVENTNQHFVTTKKCDRNDRKQSWECVGEKKYNMKQSQSSRYLYHGEHDRYITTKTTKYPPIWTRFGSNKDICSQAVGCETFSDGSSLIVLDREKCGQSLQCLGQKGIKLNRIKCFFLRYKVQYLHNDRWEALEIRNENLAIVSSYYQMVLRWNLYNTPESWKGLLIKVQFYCETIEDAKIVYTEHCVMIKYAGNLTVTLPFDNDGDVQNISDGNEHDQQNDSDGKDTAKILASVFCTSLLLCFAGVTGIVVYKRKVRFARSQGHDREDPATNQDFSPAIQELEELPNSLNNYYQSASEQSQNYAVPTREHDCQNGYVNDQVFCPRVQSHEYAIPYKYEYPDVRTGNRGYSSLSRPPLDENESENNKYTSLIKAQGTSNEEIGTNVNTDEMQFVGEVDGNYTPLVRPPLKDNDPPRYTSLLINGQTSSDADPRDSVDKAEGSSYVNEIDDNYTPLARPLLSDNETEAYQPLIKGQKLSEEFQAGDAGRKEVESRVSYVDVVDDDYTPLARPLLSGNETEAPRYQPLIKNQNTSEAAGAAKSKEEVDELPYVDINE